MTDERRKTRMTCNVWGKLVPHLRRVCTTFAVAIVLSNPRQADARNESGAEVLFQAGRDAMARGDLKEACLKFKESNDVAPAPGTVLNLGNCEELRGRIATAWEYFTRAMGMLEPEDPRHAVAEHRAKTLEKRVPRLIIELSPSAPSSSRVYRSGRALTARGQPTRVDPGEHVVTVESPGYARGTFALSIAEGEVRTIVVSPGKPLAASSTTPVLVEQSENPLPWVILGTGAVSVLGAGVLGGLSYARWMTVKERCNLDVEPHTCDTRGLEAQAQGKTMGIVALGLGVVAVASVVLYFTLPLDESTTITAGRFGNMSGVRVEGIF